MTRERLALLSILALAACLRFTALDYGRGIDARPDEPGVVLALSTLSPFGSVSPTLPLYDAGFLIPLYAFVRAARAGAWWLRSVPLDERFDVLVLARSWSAVLSLATVWMVYRVGRRAGGTSVGLIAAAWLAVCPLAVREAHSAKADTAAAFAIALLLHLATRQWKAPRGRALALGAAAGLAVSTKWMIGILPAFAYALAADVGDRTTMRVQLRRGILAFGVVTIALHWYLVVQPQWLRLLPGLLHAVRHADWLPGGDQVPGPLRYHLTVSLRFGCGLLLTVLAPISLGYGIARPGAPRLIAIAVVGLYLPLLASSMVLARFLLPAVPGLLVLGTMVLARVSDWLPRRHYLRAAVCGLAAAALLEPFYDSVMIVRLLRRTDTRIEAGAWLAEHTPTGSHVVCWGAPGLADFGSPPLPNMVVRRGLPPAQWEAFGAQWVIWHHYPLPYSSVPLPPLPPTFERAAVFSPFSGPTNAPVLEPLDAFYLPLAHFDGIVRPGPYIEVYRLTYGPVS